MRVYPPGGVCVTGVEDLVNGLVRCAEKGTTGKRYILGGHNVSFKTYFTQIAAATTGSLPWIRLPRTFLKLIGILAEPVFGLLGKNPFISKATCDMLSADLFYSSELAVRELGYAISDLSDTIQRASRAVVKNGHQPVTRPLHKTAMDEAETHARTF